MQDLHFGNSAIWRLKNLAQLGSHNTFLKQCVAVEYLKRPILPIWPNCTKAIQDLKTILAGRDKMGLRYFSRMKTCH